MENEISGAESMVVDGGILNCTKARLVYCIKISSNFIMGKTPRIGMIYTGLSDGRVVQIDSERREVVKSVHFGRDNGDCGGWEHKTRT